ncbi:MAG: hydrogenase maturation protease [Pseudomonadota bacterium]
MTSANLRVIGLGSPFGDDAVGLLAIEALERRPQFAGRVQFHALDRPGTLLIPLLQASAHVIVIDAVHSGAPPGTLQFLSLDHVRGGMHGHAPSSHGLGLAQALTLAEAIGALPQRLEVWGIEMGALPGPERSELSLALALALPDVTARIEARLTNLLA